ncbi:MAG: hypothetical protein IPM25_01500 [Chloracidobacterium sp.]|nr:hypothetical protein [Chloracidobacterium sp.]
MEFPWRPDLCENEEEFAEWQRIWQSMEHRQIPDASVIDPVRYFSYDFGNLVSATVSLAPVQYVKGLYFPVNECPLCYSDASNKDSLPASLNARFERIKALGVFVWVHRDCFEKLPLLQELPPFPA